MQVRSWVRLLKRILPRSLHHSRENCTHDRFYRMNGSEELHKWWTMHPLSWHADLKERDRTDTISPVEEIRFSGRWLRSFSDTWIHRVRRSDSDEKSRRYGLQKMRFQFYQYPDHECIGRCYLKFFFHLQQGCNIYLPTAWKRWPWHPRHGHRGQDHSLPAEPLFPTHNPPSGRPVLLT